AAGRGADQHAVAGAPVGQATAEARQQLAAGRPAQPAHARRRRAGGHLRRHLPRRPAALLARLLLGPAGGGAALGLGLRRGGAQLRQQAFQRARVLAQRLLLLLAVLVALVQLADQRRTPAALALQLGQLRGLPGAQ